jgi:demethylmenaquinone methyltransferase/2-methoxy-6-polyprenyl-1,4-benzoquinol methylase
MKSESWKMFDAISGTYDRVNRILSLGMDQRWRRVVARHLHTKGDVLDLATGTGDQALALLPHVKSLIGIDLSSQMLQIAKQKVPPPAEFRMGDAQNLPFEGETFDAATFSFGIRNVPDPLASLKEIHRVLKSKGRCLVLEFSLPPQPFRVIYLFYLRHLLPTLGGFLSRNKQAYRYLNQTIEEFPSGAAFSALMEQAEFTHLRRIPMAFGAVTLYIGEKG